MVAGWWPRWSPNTRHSTWTCSPRWSPLRWSPSRWSPWWSPSTNHRALATGGPARPVLAGRGERQWWCAGAASLVAIALVVAVVAELDLDVLTALVTIALVAAVVAEHVTRAPARPGVLAVAMRWSPSTSPAPRLNLDVLAALVAIALVAAPLSLDVLANRPYDAL